MLTSWLGAPLAYLYGLGIGIRNRLFDLKILRSKELDFPVICVGNLTVGGTGKTPVTEYLIEQFTEQYHVAVLSRGYKRRTKGFVLASVGSSFFEIGDEPKQIKLKYPEIPVAVCENRCEGIRRLREFHPEIELVILDDAFQYRRIDPWVNIILMDYNRPIYTDRMLPWGSLRDSPRQLHRAQFVLVTKCPPTINPLEKRIITNGLKLYPYQMLYFTRMKPEPPQPLFVDQAPGTILPGAPVVALCGIASPDPFLRSLAPRYKVVGKLVFEDHHVYRLRDLNLLVTMLIELPPETLVVTTEKDAVKLTNRKKIPLEIQRRLFYLPVRLLFTGGGENDFQRQLREYVRENPKNRMLHPK